MGFVGMEFVAIIPTKELAALFIVQNLTSGENALKRKNWNEFQKRYFSVKFPLVKPRGF